MFKPKKPETPRTIGLLTDFGLADPYVGQMKAVLARKAPTCTVVDISHDVSPFNVAQAGFFLAASYEHFPKMTKTDTRPDRANLSNIDVHPLRDAQ